VRITSSDKTIAYVNNNLSTQDVKLESTIANNNDEDNESNKNDTLMMGSS